jgi:hypothetical protein
VGPYQYVEAARRCRITYGCLCFGTCSSATFCVDRYVLDSPHCIPLRRMRYSGERASTYLLESAEISVAHLRAGGTVAPSSVGPCHHPAISQSANIIVHINGTGRYIAATTMILLVDGVLTSSERCVKLPLDLGEFSVPLLARTALCLPAWFKILFKFSALL